MSASTYSPVANNSVVTLVEEVTGDKPGLSATVRVGTEYFDLNGVTWKINGKGTWVKIVTTTVAGP